MYDDITKSPLKVTYLQSSIFLIYPLMQLYVHPNSHTNSSFLGPTYVLSHLRLCTCKRLTRMNTNKEPPPFPSQNFSGVLFEYDALSDEGNDSYTNYMESHIAGIINLYYPPILIIFGTICNILVVIVMTSKYFSSLSTSVFMVAGALGDALCFVIALPAHWIYVNFPHAIARTKDSHYMCKFFNFFGWGSSDFGIILTAAMTADRAVAILFPFQANRLCTARRAKIIVCLLLGSISLKEAHFLFVSDIVPQFRKDRLCTVEEPTESYSFFLERYLALDSHSLPSCLFLYHHRQQCDYHLLLS